MDIPFEVIALNEARPAVRALDQRRLPDQEVVLELVTSEEVARAIEDLVVRGAPLVGITAAYGVALAALRREPVEAVLARMRKTRPTAVNLFWALDRMERAYREGRDLVAEARAVHEDERERTLAIARNGADLFSCPVRILTICNTGILATGGVGTALGVVYELHARGLLERVIALETRPVLQGARLTVYELSRMGVPYTLIVDSQAAALMARGEVDAVIVGADRIAANGDTANKIGTLMLAVLARYFDVPFYVAAPLSTFDRNLPDGSRIPIERRSPEEVRSVRTCRITLGNAPVLNEAFDVTPAKLIRGWITERGVLEEVSHGTLGVY